MRADPKTPRARQPFAIVSDDESGAAATPLQTIADDHGLTRQRIQQRIKLLAVSLGYDPPTTGTAATGGDHQS